jgi:hypothetical protein
MASNFDFNSLDPVALEAMLEFFEQNPEPPTFEEMLRDATGQWDWIALGEHMHMQDRIPDGQSG